MNTRQSSPLGPTITYGSQALERPPGPRDSLYFQVLLHSSVHLQTSSIRRQLIPSTKGFSRHVMLAFNATLWGWLTCQRGQRILDYLALILNLWSLWCLKLIPSSQTPMTHQLINDWFRQAKAFFVWFLFSLWPPQRLLLTMEPDPFYCQGFWELVLMKKMKSWDCVFSLPTESLRTKRKPKQENHVFSWFSACLFILGSPLIAIQYHICEPNIW